MTACRATSMPSSIRRSTLTGIDTSARVSFGPQRSRAELRHAAFPPLHPLEQPRVAAAHLELFGAALDADELAAAQVARHVGDVPGVDERGAMNLPEDLGVELLHELLDRLSDQRLDGCGLHARVLLVGDEEQ